MAKSCSFEATIVAVDYAAPLDQLVLGLKFGAQLDLAALMARLLAEAARALPAFPRPALLVPVPLGRQRLIQRGFNQALEIARPLGRALDIPVTSRLVTRVRETGAQSLLHPDARRRNVAGAFAVLPGASAALYGRHIGVVDDVMTTGETLDALASTLCAGGAASVTNFVFARTLPN
ncbi:MAG TPA: ComF family protein [Noviherbaspirillum sp.]